MAAETSSDNTDFAFLDAMNFAEELFFPDCASKLTSLQSERHQRFRAADYAHIYNALAQAKQPILPNLCAAFTEDIKAANKKQRFVEDQLGVEAVQLFGDVVYVNILITDLDTTTRTLWDLQDASHISVRLKVSLGSFRSSFVLLPVSAVPVDVSIDLPPKLISEQLLNIARKFVETKRFIPDQLSSSFYQLHRYLQSRLPTLNKFCVICGSRFSKDRVLIWPSICRREFCVFQSNQFKMHTWMKEIAAESLHVQLCLFSLAFNRKTETFTLCDRPNSLQLDISSKISNDVPLEARYPTPFSAPIHLETKELTRYYLREQFNLIFSAIPCVREISRRDDFIRFCCDQNELPAEIVKWIKGSTNVLLHPIPVDKQLKSFETPHQFLMFSGTPKSRVKFECLKKESGDATRFMFFRANLEDWHEIFRYGIPCPTEHFSHSDVHSRCCPSEKPQLPRRFRHVVAVCEVIEDFLQTEDGDAGHKLVLRDAYQFRMLLVWEKELDYVKTISGSDRLQIAELTKMFLDGEL